MQRRHDTMKPSLSAVQWGSKGLFPRDIVRCRLFSHQSEGRGEATMRRRLLRAGLFFACILEILGIECR